MPVTVNVIRQLHQRIHRYVSEQGGDWKPTDNEIVEASSQGWHQSEHNVGPWLECFWGVLLRAYKEFENRLGDLSRSGISKSQRVREAIERKVGPFRILEIERICPDVSRETIRLVLRAMKKEGLIEPKGRGRGARWRKLK